MLLFSERLRWLRERQGLSQKDMAEQLGMSQQGYSHIETGKREPNLDTLIKIRHVLNETLDFITGYRFQDSRSDQLYELYAEARSLREEREEDINYYEENLEDNVEKVEIRLRLLKQHRDELKQLKIKEEKALKMFFDYISTVPGYNETVDNKEFWIEQYATYQENDKQLYEEFWEEFQKL